VESGEAASGRGGDWRRSGNGKWIANARPPQRELAKMNDCRSMVALPVLGISEVLTNDHHFTQEGFTIPFF
jgi:hypothetical protein